MTEMRMNGFVHMAAAPGSDGAMLDCSVFLCSAFVTALAGMRRNCLATVPVAATTGLVGMMLS